MKEIVLSFLTPRGEAAYKEVEEEGKKESYMNRQIVRRVFRQQTVSENPLVIKIICKIPRLAEGIMIQNNIYDSLHKKGCVQDKDYTLQVIY